MQGPKELRKKRFDCLLINNLLYLLEDPAAVILEFSRLLTASGCLLIKEPNFGNIQTHGGRLLGKQAFRGLETFSRSRVTPVTTGRLRSWLKAAGFKIHTTIPIAEEGASRRVQILQATLLRFSSESVAVAACRQA
jgi:2-polyprenyl-3-methyl-5-hydroxy-6-metoxy-1,4-benzoquinol methylase